MKRSSLSPSLSILSSRDSLPIALFGASLPPSLPDAAHTFKLEQAGDSSQQTAAIDELRRLESDLSLGKQFSVEGGVVGSGADEGFFEHLGKLAIFCCWCEHRTQPMEGKIESLNAAVAGSVVLYLAYLERQKRP